MTVVRRAMAVRRRVALRGGMAPFPGIALFCGIALVVAHPAWSAPTHHNAARPVAAPSHAAAPAAGWNAAGCGREPVAPVVETSTIARYNASIDAVTAYDQAARSYNACVSRTATAEQTAISAQAKQRIDSIQAVSEAVQRRIAANFQLLGAALKKGPPGH